MFTRLFAPKSDGKDGLTQPQREAIVDVLNYCMYADNFIALSESQFIAQNIESLSWDPKISLEYYLNKSIGEVRKALSSPESKQQFFKSVNERLATKALRETTLSLSQKLFVADGNKSASESVVQSELGKYLKE